MERIVFMGTPDFALPSLEVLAADYHVVGVVTQPDRPVGRGRVVAPSPVKRTAQRLGLPVYQPRTLREPATLQPIVDWRPDVIVVAAFGLILPSALLELPPAGCLNVHASLLPRWRGAAPIAAAILAGDAVTGVTLMKMDAGVDTGPVLAQRSELICADDTQATLGARLARLGANLLRETLPAYLQGALVARPQPEEGVTYAPPLRKADGWLDWSRPAVVLDRQVRAYTPWPGAFTEWQGRQLKVLQARPVPEWRGDVLPGTVVVVDGELGVATGEGALLLVALQLAGKRPMDGMAFARGQRDFINSRLGACGCSARAGVDGQTVHSRCAAGA